MPVPSKARRPWASVRCGPAIRFSVDEMEIRARRARPGPRVSPTAILVALLVALGPAPAMRRAGGGRIVNVSDWLPVSGRPSYTGYTPYYASKAAVKALTESLALELAPDVLVNAVAPGPILAPPGLTPEEDAAVLRATPLGRWGGAEEIAKAVLFLIETDFITGESIRVDGGRHLS